MFAGVEGDPIPDDQIDLLIALRRVERERGRQSPDQGVNDATQMLVAICGRGQHQDVSG